MYKGINSTENWTTIKTKDIWETTEGGEAKFYYLKYIVISYANICLKNSILFRIVPYLNKILTFYSARF